MAETSYAPCGGLSLAYQVFGDGPVELVYAGSFVSHLEVFWTMPEFEAFMERLSTFCRVLLFDKAGVGLSDPVPQVRTLDERAAEIEAVMDAAGFGRAVLFGLSEGGPAAMLFAATRPERTRALILSGTFAYFGITGWADFDRDPVELHGRMLAETGQEYTPSIEQLIQFQEFGRASGSVWGTGAALKRLFPAAGSVRQLGMFERMSASPGMARATLEAMFRIDARPILSTITAPTLVIHATGDLVPIQGGRYLADHIPGARLLEVDGTDHAPWIANPDEITSEIEEFLTGSHAAPSQSHRALRTVLFTDMVASTQHAAATGIHTGECELLDGDIGGIAVHIAARILGLAGAGEILVSSTVRDLVVGSGTGFEDRGDVELRGVPGTWRLLAVDRHGARAGTPEAELASVPTPGPRPTMRRSDLAMAVMARRMPRIVRGIARVTPGTRVTGPPVRR